MDYLADNVQLVIAIFEIFKKVQIDQIILTQSNLVFPRIYFKGDMVYVVE